MASKQREFDHLFKLVLIGDASVGKTSLLLRFADDSFEDNYISTVGVDFRFRTVMTLCVHYIIPLTDVNYVNCVHYCTYYMPRRSAYYRGANGVILVYDITNNETFQHVQDWLDEVHKAAGETVTKLVVGNKADLESQRQVNEQQAHSYAQSVNASFIETSAKTAANVDKSFLIIAKQLVQKRHVSCFAYLRVFHVCPPLSLYLYVCVCACV